MLSTSSQRDVTTARAHAITIFCAYIGFVVAGLAFWQVTDDLPVAVHLTGAHPLMALSWLTVAGGSVLAVAAVLTAGVPIALAALWHALIRAKRANLLLFAVPIPAFIAFALAGGFAGSGPLHALFPAAVNAGISLGAAVVSTAAIALAVMGGQVSRWLYRLALLPALVATLGMGLMLAGTGAWGLLAVTSAPRTLSGAGIAGLSAGVSLLLILAVMALTTGIAAVTTLRGLLSRATLDDLRGLRSAVVRLVVALVSALFPKRLTPTERLREQYAHGDLDYPTLRERLHRVIIPG